jgi:predicted DNA-binding mobile mystery protein A
MKKLKKLQIEQLDTNLPMYRNLPPRPQKGWIQGVRIALNMSYRQFGKRLGVAAQSAQEIEQREKDGSISLKVLGEAAAALNMRLVYGLVPVDGSFEKTLEKRSLEIARQIVMRTDNTMRLENQQVSKERLEKDIKLLAGEIQREMPRYLWD